LASCHQGQTISPRRQTRDRQEKKKTCVIFTWRGLEQRRRGGGGICGGEWARIIARNGLSEGKGKKKGKKTTVVKKKRSRGGGKKE